MKVLLWILAGILLVDVGLVVVVAACTAVARRRGPRAMRDPVTWWPMEPAPGLPQGAGSTILPFDRRPSIPIASPGAGGRRGAHRPAVAAVVAAAIFAGSAFASPEVRRIVATAIDGMTGGIISPGSSDAQGDRTTTSDADGPASEAPADPGGDAPSSGGGPGAAGSPGPEVGPRPPGVPHGGVLPPPAPTGLSAGAASSSQVDLTWTGVADATGYRIERSSDGAGGWAAIGETVPGVTSWTDAGLPPGSTTYYRVVASNPGGDSPPSNVASATTPAEPASPAGVTAVATSPTQIDLRWIDVGTEFGYRVERSDGSGGWTAVATTGQDVDSASDTGLTPGTTYSYRVVAVNAVGDSAASEVASATTPSEPGDATEGSDPVAEDPGAPASRRSAGRVRASA